MTNASKPVGRFLTIGTNGAVNLHGIDLPAKTRVLARNADAVTLHVPGHSYWSGLHGDRGYAPAEVQVFRVVKIEKFDGHRFVPLVGDPDQIQVRYEVEPLISYPARAKKG